MFLLLWLGFSISVAAQERFIIVQSTTSTQNSGLFDHLLAVFEQESGIDVRVVAVGTGQAIRNATHGDGDVLFVHSRKAEEQFIEEGFGVERFDVMYNDFVIAGTADDPAGIAGMDDVIEAFQRLKETGAIFISRGDDSGTHKKEMSLWAEAGIDPIADSGSWYRETGSGMGAALNIATSMQAYILTDRATWIAFANKGDHDLLVEGDARLFNQYGVILVNPEIHGHVKADDGQLFIDWLLSEKGQTLIGNYRIDGQQLFYPNAQ